ncbi:uncharacterized protein [Penaeus vannamei]|uniref:uncharacterized protein n=1 Tax=Penaeus vannamei TaxID=6689 RepID=UPI00387F9B58
MKVYVLLVVVAVVVAMASADDGERHPDGRRPPPPDGRRPPNGGSPPKGGSHNRRGPPPCTRYLCGENEECPKCVRDIIHAGEDDTLKNQLRDCYDTANDCRDESTVDASALTDCIAAVSEDLPACFPAK